MLFILLKEQDDHQAKEHVHKRNTKQLKCSKKFEISIGYDGDEDIK